MHVGGGLESGQGRTSRVCVHGPAVPLDSAAGSAAARLSLCTCAGTLAATHDSHDADAIVIVEPRRRRPRGTVLLFIYSHGRLLRLAIKSSLAQLAATHTLTYVFSECQPNWNARNALNAQRIQPTINSVNSVGCCLL